MQSIHPLMLAFLAGLFTWAMTALGAAAIFLRRNPSQRLMDILLGFSAGVMLAASYWSLLAPAVEIARETSSVPWLAPSLGFAAGGIGLWALDKVMPHAHLMLPGSAARARRRADLVGPQHAAGSRRSRSTTSPRGSRSAWLQGAAASGAPGTSVGAAVALAIGLGVQNFPEGLAVSALLRREGQTRGRATYLGAMTGSVEPIAAVLGAALIGLSMVLLPWGLAFAAGAMVFIVIEELVPECQQCGNGDAAVLAAISASR